MTSRQETDTLAYLDKRSKQHHVTLNSRLTAQNAFPLFSTTSKPCALFTLCFLTREACLYAGLMTMLIICQRVERGRLSSETYFLSVSQLVKWCFEPSQPLGIISALKLVSWCLEPSQPQRITSGLNTNFTLSPSHSQFTSHHNTSHVF